MATTNDTREGPQEAANNLDDLFDYDVGIEDIMNDVSGQANNTSSSNDPSQPAANKDSVAGLGLDEEIQVTKKRKPTVKFDETRLLSQAGIPKLRKTAKTKLKFKGKGHEFSDAARLLNFYQLWLDDLFPRAKFADGLAMVEKLGHSKRIQTMRREWIDESKPRLYYENENNESNGTTINAEEGTSNNAPSTEPEQAPPSAENSTTQQSENAIASIFGGGGNTAPTRPSASDAVADDNGLFCTDEEDNNSSALPKANNNGVPEEDELDALLAEQGVTSTPPRRNNDAVPGEDELDALLAEQDAMAAESNKKPPPPSNGGRAGPGTQRPPADEFEDEWEAMGVDDW